MDQLAPIDQRILDLVKEIRHELGACTTGHVSSRMGMSRDLIRVRCHIMREQGLLTWTSAAGSLQVVEDTIGMKLFEQLVIQAVERRAAQTEGDDINEWCRMIMDEARAATWPVPVAEQESKDDGDTPSLVEDELNPTSPHRDDQIRCELCDRTFRGIAQLQGHERSKVHLAKVSEAFGVPAA